MIDEKDMLVEGERRLGRYTAVILRPTANGGWSPALMQLDTVVTNYRLMLRPHRKKYEPASIPARYIQAVLMARHDRYHCVQMNLSGGFVLCLMLQTGKLSDLFDDLHAMKAPAPRFHFDDKVARNDIERLITFFGREPLPNPMSGSVI